MFKLTRVFDCRPLDPFTGKRDEVDRDQLPTCHRCRRRHAKIWQFTEIGTGEIVNVGPACGSKLASTSPEAFNFTQNEVLLIKTAEKGRLSAVFKERVQARALELAQGIPFPPRSRR